jgi:NADH-ubiquinone oxidoreductase chain 6
MNTLYTLTETFSNGYKGGFLDILSLIAILCGILVIISKNPIVSVLFLIALFLSISCYLMVLGLNFIGLSYLLVYVGAVSILFLFILMLINIRVSELLSNTSNSIPLAIIIAISFYFTMYDILPYSLTGFNSYTINIYSLYTYLYNNTLLKLSNIGLDNDVLYFATSPI